MPKLFGVSSSDLRTENYLFPQIEKCSHCKYFDRYEAVKLPIRALLKVPSGRDVFWSNDGFLVFSERAKTFFDTESIQGFDFFAIEQTSYFASLTNHFISLTDDEESSYFTIRQCSKCGAEKAVGLLVGKMAENKPDIDGKTVFGVERQRGAYCLEETAKILRKGKLKGLSLSEMHYEPLKRLN